MKFATAALVATATAATVTTTAVTKVCPTADKNSDANKTACGTTIWNYVDADLHIDGFAARIGEHYESWFNDMVDC